MTKAWRRADDHIRLSIKLTPNGGRDRFCGVDTDADGEAYLKARVSVVPEKGKANKALIALIAKSLSIPKSSVSILSGDTARKKILRIDGDPEDVSRKLDLIAVADA